MCKMCITLILIPVVHLSFLFGQVSYRYAGNAGSQEGPGQPPPGNRLGTSATTNQSGRLPLADIGNAAASQVSSLDGLNNLSLEAWQSLLPCTPSVLHALQMSTLAMGCTHRCQRICQCSSAAPKAQSPTIAAGIPSLLQPVIEYLMVRLCKGMDQQATSQKMMPINNADRP